MTTLHLRNPIGPATAGRGFFLIALALACFALLPTPNAFGVSPAPDGGYPNGNTAEGTNALFSLSAGHDNTANGFQALFSNSSGFHNTAMGFEALYHNNAADNTATGWLALFRNTTGTLNTANGSFALYNNTTGYYNTANGAFALHSNTTGNDNTATGVSALYSNKYGADNTANGYWALQSNIAGNLNTATGFQALYSNTTGLANTANGASALQSNIGGSFNTANGLGALSSNTDGDDNAANGNNALFHNTTGANNTANGSQALLNNTAGHDNTANGFKALLNNTGSNNIGLGSNAGSSLTNGSGNVCIGQGVLGVAGESNTTRIRNVYSSVASGRAVYVNSDNKIGTIVSSRRFKEEIMPMDKASETILALKPVTFRYKKEIEPNGAIMFGLIAEEVEKVDPDLVTRDDKGEAETVRYEAVNAMLLNEFLKEHRTVQELKSIVAKQEAIIAQQQKGMAAVIARLKEQDSKIQNVNDQLELSSPRRAAQLAGND